MSKFGFLVVNFSSRRELITAFLEKTPVTIDLQPFEETRELGFANIAIDFLLTGIREDPEPNPYDGLLFEGIRQKKENPYGKIEDLPNLLENWKFVTGFFNYHSKQGFAYLKTEPNELKLLRDVLREVSFYRFMIDELD